MSRSTKVSESPAPFMEDEDIYGSSPAPSRPQLQSNGNGASSPSPAASVSSDKENQSSRVDVGKGKERVPMGPPRLPSPADDRNKRKRTIERDTTVERNRRRRALEPDEEGRENISDNDYDPEQSIEDRRRVRKGLREISKYVVDNRSELMAAGNTGLRDALAKADRWTEEVKQTSDATIDARLLVQTADLSYKKTVALTTGDSAQGVDLEDFLTKCRAYLRTAPSDDSHQRAPSNTQRRHGQNDDEEDDDGDMFNWAYFGRVACLPNISRPAVPGFLLGPLSVEKRAKRVVVRRAALKVSSIQETQPEILRKDDIEENENALTTLCTQILIRAQKVQANAMAKAEDEVEEDMSEKEVDAIFDRLGISKQGDLALLKLVINPYSFGQTVENMFYVSFLIKEGKAAINVADDGMPYFDPQPPETGGAQSVDRNAKHQAVLSLDMKMWKEAIELFDIKEPMIRHREEETVHNAGRTGWF